jgi:hypothetical protein
MRVEPVVGWPGYFVTESGLVLGNRYKRVISRACLRLGSSAGYYWSYSESLCGRKRKKGDK